MELRGSNPTFSEKIYANAAHEITGDSKVMTVNGTVNKTFIMLLLLMASAIFTWGLALGAEPMAALPYMIGGAIGGLILGIVMGFKMQWSGILAPIYAVLEGLFIGGISAFFSRAYDGIVVQAVALTFGTLFIMLAAYRFKIITVTEKLKAGIIAATGAVALFYLVLMIVNLFSSTPSFYASSSPLSIGISVVIVAIAAFNLLLDFDFIEKGSALRVPKYMEWYAAFGLMVTLVWLYLEILRLLSKLQSRD